MRALFLTNAQFGYIHLFAFTADLPPERAADAVVLARPSDRTAADREPAYLPLYGLGLIDRVFTPGAHRKGDRSC